MARKSARARKGAINITIAFDPTYTFIVGLLAIVDERLHLALDTYAEKADPDQKSIVLFAPGAVFLHKGCATQEKFMTIPTVDQTEGIWIDRTNDRGNHYIQEIFFKEGQSDLSHRSNCNKLIHRGSLQPEHADHLQPDQRNWDQEQRYHRVHQ